MMLPILISVSLAPGSYFFSADAGGAEIAVMAASIAKAKCRIRTGIVPSLHGIYFCRSVASRTVACKRRLFRGMKRHCCAPPFMIDAWKRRTNPSRSTLKKPAQRRIGPRHPRLGAAAFRAVRWLSVRLFSAAGFHQLGSAFADQRIAHIREKLGRGETVYLAGLGAPGTHNSGLALVEVTKANGPRLIVNNEEERF